MYGRKFAIITAILNLVTLLGFNMSYIVYVILDRLINVNLVVNSNA